MPEGTVLEVIDIVDLSVTSGFYYKAYAYDSSSVLKKTYEPVYLPQYAEADRPLILVGTPPASQVGQCAAEEKKTERLDAVVRVIGRHSAEGAEPWNSVFVTDEDFTLGRGQLAQELGSSPSDSRRGRGDVLSWAAHCAIRCRPLDG